LIIISNIYWLGAGQQAEVKHMNEKGIQYHKVFALSTGFACAPRRGFKTNDALKKAASDGPIEMGTPPRAYVRSALSAWV